ncbi:hypothetical protein GCK72_019587 [Caenorhabditis remanei]|uniref:Serpentine Receptor, class H n=1 Tax=Caenorhabditis remanei TaxID=31234 RepID=A0A6A5GEJ5_CAERE|nr:hypothetical protein GCK72_019587 [Caenorhabditis remanei]KAF1753031.1 hypothetical protein GCK72_019587 [Caenorhabditis remanei]
MTECNPDSSYLASPEFVTFSFHVITSVTIPVMTFGAYCILFKTPNKMKSVKLLMLNLHFWSTLSDMTISFFGVPYLRFPTLSGYGLGVINVPGLLFYCGVTFILALTASILAIYENRYYSLFGRHNSWRLVRKPFLAATYISVPFIFISPYLNLPEQDSARRIVLSTLPCLPEFTYSNLKLFVLSLNVTIPFLCILFSCVFFAISIISFFLLTVYHLVSEQQGTIHSFRTLAIQKNFLIAVTIQTAFTIIIVLAPVLVFIFIVIAWYHNQKLNNFVCLTLSIHGVGSTIVMDLQIVSTVPTRSIPFKHCIIQLSVGAVCLNVQCDHLCSSEPMNHWIVIVQNMKILLEVEAFEQLSVLLQVNRGTLKV